MNSRKIIEYLFFSIVSMIGTIGVSYVRDISATMALLNKNITELNLKMLSAAHALDDHESRLRKIEFKGAK